jgi:two-component system sensor histidine kinase KdpD
MSQDQGAEFLQMIRRSERGRLKVYLGYAAGVGKTSRMLEEGHRLRQEGLDVVVGLVETHGRRYTAALAEGLELFPATRREYRGVGFQEMDLDGLLKRRPQVVLVDELAHSNAPGSRYAKRYQDIQELRAAGIHVISTLNVQHLESLYDTVEHMTSVKVRERVPDLVLNDADEVVNVDLAAADLIQRLRQGQIYPFDQVQAALDNFFKPGNLEQLRELALRELASRIDFRRREEADQPGRTTDQLLVALSARLESHAALLRYASRLAGRLNRNWYVVHVRTPRESAQLMDPAVQQPVAATLALANQLGAIVFTVKGEDVVEALLDFAQRYRVGYLIVGKPRRLHWAPWSRHNRVVERLLGRRGQSVLVVDTNIVEDVPRAQPAAPALRLPRLGAQLDPTKVIIPGYRMDYGDLVLALCHRALQGLSLDPEAAAQTVMERESRSSSFLNVGLALPHASLPGLIEPRMALALPKMGLRGPTRVQPVEAIFLLLTPLNAESRHLELLSAVGRAFQDAGVRAAFRAAESPEEALDALKAWEGPF